jgi:hypothetical protein
VLHLCLERENLRRPPYARASQYGLDRCIFDHTCEQPDTAAWLEASHKEGLGNGVTAAPASFLNGRRIQDTLDLETPVDLAQEEHDRLTQAPAKASGTAKASAHRPK